MGRIDVWVRTHLQGYFGILGALTVSTYSSDSALADTASSAKYLYIGNVNQPQSRELRQRVQHQDGGLKHFVPCSFTVLQSHDTALTALASAILVVDGNCDRDSFP